MNYAPVDGFPLHDAQNRLKKCLEKFKVGDAFGVSTVIPNVEGMLDFTNISDLDDDISPLWEGDIKFGGTKVSAPNTWRELEIVYFLLIILLGRGSAQDLSGKSTFGGRLHELFSSHEFSPERFIRDKS